MTGGGFPSADEISAHIRREVARYLGETDTAGWGPCDFAMALADVREEGGPNKGPPDTLYNMGLDDGSAWCALAVMAWFICSGRPLHQTASQWWRWRSAASLIAALEPHRLPNSADAQPGDIGRVFRPGGSGSHVFLIVGNNDDTLATVEGNVTDRTVLRWRPATEVDVFRPVFEEDEPCSE